MTHILKCERFFYIWKWKQKSVLWWCSGWPQTIDLLRARKNVWGRSRIRAQRPLGRDEAISLWAGACACAHAHTRTGHERRLFILPIIQSDPTAQHWRHARGVRRFYTSTSTALNTRVRNNDATRQHECLCANEYNINTTSRRNFGSVNFFHENDEFMYNTFFFHLQTSQLFRIYT